MNSTLLNTPPLKGPRVFLLPAYLDLLGPTWTMLSLWSPSQQLNTFDQKSQAKSSPTPDKESRKEDESSALAKALRKAGSMFQGHQRSIRPKPDAVASKRPYDRVHERLISRSGCRNAAEQNNRHKARNRFEHQAHQARDRP